MAEEIERSAASVEEAIEAALRDLGVSEQEVDVEIVQEPKGGFLGLKSQQAVVKVRRLSPAVSAETLEEQAEVAAELLDGLFDAMDLDVEVETGLDDGMMYVDVWGAESDEGMALLIGRHGQTLDALQELIRTAVMRRTGERCRVMVDVEDYRKRRRRQLISKAGEAGRRVKESGEQEPMEPMSPFERKIVHDAIAELGGLETMSEGEEPNRRVVIRKK